MSGKTLKLTPKESVTVRESSPEQLEVEVSYAPEGKPPPKHWHPSQEERFEVIEGSIRTRVGGEERELRAGDTLAIPRGAVHQIWNPGQDPARVTWRTTPRLRTHEWFAAIDGLYRQGRWGERAHPARPRSPCSSWSTATCSGWP